MLWWTARQVEVCAESLSNRAGHYCCGIVLSTCGGPGIANDRGG